MKGTLRSFVQFLIPIQQNHCRWSIPSNQMTELTVPWNSLSDTSWYIPNIVWKSTFHLITRLSQRWLVSQEKGGQGSMICSKFQRPVCGYVQDKIATRNTFYQDGARAGPSIRLGHFRSLQVADWWGMTISLSLCVSVGFQCSSTPWIGKGTGEQTGRRNGEGREVLSEDTGEWEEQRWAPDWVGGQHLACYLRCHEVMG